MAMKSALPMSVAFQSVLDVAADAIIVTDHLGHIGAFNNAAEGLFGYRKQEVLGANVASLIPIPYMTGVRDPGMAFDWKRIK